MVNISITENDDSFLWLFGYSDILMHQEVFRGPRQQRQVARLALSTFTLFKV